MFDIRYALIRKMARRDYWGNRLINLSDLIKIVPPHLRKEAKEAIKELFKEGWVNRKPGNRGEFRYSLKPNLKQEIAKILERGYF